LDTVWFVKLGDIGPEGKVTLTTQAHLKASFREVDESRSKPGQPFHPFQNPVLPEANSVYEYQIEMMPIFHTFKKGHKIWVQIASDDFEYQGRLRSLYIYEGLPFPGKNKVYHDAKYPSHLVLPVVPDAPIIIPVGPPVSEIKWPL
jgi:predicted acyl esterase